MRSGRAAASSFWVPASTPLQPGIVTAPARWDRGDDEPSEYVRCSKGCPAGPPPDGTAEPAAL